MSGSSDLGDAPLPKFSSLPPRLAATVTLTVTTAMLVVALVTGCTSDTPSLVGANLAETAIDTVLAPLTIEQLADFGVLAVSDPAVPLDETEVLYFGNSDTEQSSILVNYDFSSLDHPDSAYLLPFLTIDNISSAEIRLYKLTWYSNDRDGQAPPDGDVLKPYPGVGKIIDVHELMAPFDTLSYPGAEPEYNPAFISTYVEIPDTNDILAIDCAVAPVVAWLDSRGEVGVILREDSRSDPGVIGFASKEMVHGGSTLPLLNANTTLGAALRVELIEKPAQWVGRDYAIFGPAADISTWHQLQPAYTDPADGIMVRTHLRSYPMLRFDLDALPQHVRINRANLVVVNDTSRSEGHRTVLTASELRPEFAPPGETTVFLRDLEPEIYFLFGNGSWQPEHLTEHELNFNVTSSVQRFINSVYEGDRGFLIAAGEYFFPGYNSNPDPDFWFTKWIFHGTAAAPELRPRLEISYTRLDELTDPEGTQ